MPVAIAYHIDESLVVELPKGWEKLNYYDRTYYIDHNTKTTHWKLPT